MDGWIVRTCSSPTAIVSIKNYSRTQAYSTLNLKMILVFSSCEIEITMAKYPVKGRTKNMFRNFLCDFFFVDDTIIHTRHK